MVNFVMLLPRVSVGLVVAVPVIIVLRNMLMKKIFPVKVLIKEKRGDAVVLKHDRAKRVKKEGKEKYKLMKAKETIEPPKYDNYIINEKGQAVLELFSPTSDDYRPIKFKDLPDVQVEDKAARFWFVQEFVGMSEKYAKPSVFEKYAPYIAVAFVAALTMIQFIFWYKSTGTMAANLENAGRAFAHASESIQEAARAISGIQTPPMT